MSIFPKDLYFCKTCFTAGSYPQSVLFFLFLPPPAPPPSPHRAILQRLLLAVLWRTIWDTREIWKSSVQLSVLLLKSCFFISWWKPILWRYSFLSQDRLVFQGFFSSIAIEIQVGLIASFDVLPFFVLGFSNFVSEEASTE